MPATALVVFVQAFFAVEPIRLPFVSEPLVVDANVAATVAGSVWPVAAAFENGFMDAKDMPPLEHPVAIVAEPASREASRTRRALFAGFTVFSPQHPTRGSA